MKNLLPAILILSALIALFSLYGTPEEATPTEGWAFYGGNTTPAHGEGEDGAPAQAEPTYPQAMDSTSPVTGEFT